YVASCFCSCMPRPLTSTLFPYTTLFRSLRFYRLLGLEAPPNSEREPYVEVITPNGYRISWNSQEMIKSIDPEWVEPVGQRISLRSEEHTSELQSLAYLVCRLLLEKKKKI